jgi:hypothetical protein
MFDQMVEILKSYEGKRICHSIPTQSEWSKANHKAILNGTYISDSDIPDFRTEKRHYKKLFETAKGYEFK